MEVHISKKPDNFQQLIFWQIWVFKKEFWNEKSVE